MMLDACAVMTFSAELDAKEAGLMMKLVGTARKPPGHRGDT